ncbi:FAD-dependent oxidoreductase, partial [bacterium]|nr:FAD-dependent oxidoreductase [bacterium]
MKKVDLAIIGGGRAGLAAAISAYDQGIKSLVIFEKDDHLGGILFQCIHSGFGLQEFKEQLSGPEYAER